MKSLGQIVYNNQLAFTKFLLAKIKKDQGFTLNGERLDQKIYTDGYQVSVRDVFLIPIEGLTAETLLNDYLAEMYANNTENYDIGLWLSDGDVYLDYSVNILDLNKALKIGKKYNQQMLYDWANDDFIPVK